MNRISASWPINPYERLDMAHRDIDFTLCIVKIGFEIAPPDDPLWTMFCRAIEQRDLASKEIEAN